MALNIEIIPDDLVRAAATRPVRGVRYYRPPTVALSVGGVITADHKNAVIDHELV